MKKIVYLDMDGTIADLYSQENWLEKLHNEDEKVFIECKPLINEEKLFTLYPPQKYELRICSMTPKNATKQYCQNVIEQKNLWLDKFFPSIKKRYYLPYGKNKNFKNSKNCILIDDSAEIRNCYKGLALAPNWC